MSHKTFPYSWSHLLLGIVSIGATLAMAPGCQPAAAEPKTKPGAAVDVSHSAEVTKPIAGFGGDPIWDDGLSEMSYYAAADLIYDKEREYTRVVLINREWLDPKSRVKTDRSPQKAELDPAARPIPVLKMNLAEEIPTENYNYRILLTVFFQRDSLSLEKLTASCQEWCGATFEQWLRSDGGLQIRSFSYFEGEADQTQRISDEGDLYPPEGLMILARDLVARPRKTSIRKSHRVRSNHAGEVSFVRLTGSVETRAALYECAIGRLAVDTVDFRNESGDSHATFVVERASPYRLLAYAFKDGSRGRLALCERRAYWDRGKPSRYYPQGAAP